MSDQKLFHPNIVVKMDKNRCKSAQTSNKCWSISLKFGPKITCHSLNLIAYPAGNRMSKRNQKDTGYDIQNSCLFEIRNDIIC